MPVSSPSKGSPGPRTREKRKAEALNDTEAPKDSQDVVNEEDENNENSNENNSSSVCIEVPEGKRSKKWIDPSRRRSNIPKPEKFDIPEDLEDCPSKDTAGDNSKRFQISGKNVGTILKKPSNEGGEKRKFVTWYICDMPDCTFRSKHGKGKLKQHLLNVHKLTDEVQIKWYTCPFADNGCVFKSKQRGHLKRHMYQVHNKAEGDELVKGEDGEEKSKLKFYQCICEGCNFETMRWGNLKRHYMKIHGYAENELPEENKIVYKELELKEDSKPAAKPKVTKSTRPEKVSEKVSTEKVGKSKKKSTTDTEANSEKGETSNANTGNENSESVNNETLEEEDDNEMTML